MPQAHDAGRRDTGAQVREPRLLLQPGAASTSTSINQVTALLGTNGAPCCGVITDSRCPSTASCACDRRNITYVSPEQHARRLGMLQQQGHPTPAPERTWAVGTAARRGVAPRSRRAQWPVRPVPGARRPAARSSASGLSGGQQQMLTLAQHVLIHEPRLRMESTNCRSGSRRWSCNGCSRSSRT